MVYGMIWYMVETFVTVDVHGWHMVWYKIDNGMVLMYMVDT
jgi:hypothetical protein